MGGRCSGGKIHSQGDAESKLCAKACGPLVSDWLLLVLVLKALALGQWRGGSHQKWLSSVWLLDRGGYQVIKYSVVALNYGLRILSFFCNLPSSPLQSTKCNCTSLVQKGCVQKKLSRNEILFQIHKCRFLFRCITVNHFINGTNSSSTRFFARDDLTWKAQTSWVAMVKDFITKWLAYWYYTLHVEHSLHAFHWVQGGAEESGGILSVLSGGFPESESQDRIPQNGWS